MGVSQYYLRYIKNYLSGKVRGLVRTRLEVIIDSLNLDANALVHQARNSLFEYPEQASDADRRRVYGNRALPLEQQWQLLAKQTWALITEITTAIRPRHVITIMFDGVVPVAKMKQQRARRFHHAADDADNTGYVQVVGPNDISVSTDLMEYVHRYIMEQIDMLPQTGDPVFPPLIVYSSHHRPGEGEHKILDAFRDGTVPLNYGGYHMLWGLDNDLFQLGLLLPTNRVILGRDDGTVEFVFLDVLKERLTLEMGFPPSQFASDNSVGVEYVALMTLVGNDFLPRVVGVNSLDYDIPALLDAYRRMRGMYPSLTLITNRGTINRQGWIALLNNLLDHQWSQIEYQQRNPKDSAFWETVKKNLNLSKQEDREKFRRMYYQREYDYLTFSTLSSKYDPALLPSAARPLDEHTRRELMEGMSYYFIQGINWVVNYYNVGMSSINKTYYYPYYTAPMFEELIKYLSSDEYVDDSRWSAKHSSNQSYNALDQLLMTAPANSSMLSWWPRQLRKKYPELMELAPRSFMTTSDTGSFEWYHQPLLPPLDPEMVHERTKFSERQGATLDNEPLPQQFRQTSVDTMKVRTFMMPKRPREGSYIREVLAPREVRRVADTEDITLQSLAQGFRRSRRTTGRGHSPNVVKRPPLLETPPVPPQVPPQQVRRYHPPRSSKRR